MSASIFLSAQDAKINKKRLYCIGREIAIDVFGILLIMFIYPGGKLIVSRRLKKTDSLNL